MSQNDDSKGVTVSVKIYELLLAAYPAKFRREYGPAMQQLFRDQCREAWSTRREWGLAVLWLRVVLDWAKTSVVEHLLNLHRKESLLMNIFRTLLTNSRPWSAFIKVFALVFGGALLCSALVACFSPKLYSSTIQIQVEKHLPEELAGLNYPTTQFKIIGSYRILTNVIADLHLDEKLARQYGAKRWTVDDTFDYLVHNLSVQQPRAGSLIEISVTNSDPELAASIANGTANSYKLFRMEQLRDIQLMKFEAARSANRPHPEYELGYTCSDVIVCNPARADLSSCVQPELRIFRLWVLGGTLLALLAGVWSAGSARQSSAR